MELFWSLNCRDCFNCKQKTIKTYEDLCTFAYNKDNEVRKGWRAKLRREGRIDFYWCKLDRQQKLKALPPGEGQKREVGKFCQHIDN